jgi:protein SCO1/2
VKRFSRPFLPALLFMLFLGCNKSAPKPDVYTMNGTVVSIDSASHQATISHGPIPGFMEAMTMPYLVKDDAELKKLSAGDQIDADLLVSKETGEMWLSNIHVTKPATNNTK